MAVAVAAGDVLGVLDFPAALQISRQEIGDAGAFARLRCAWSAGSGGIPGRAPPGPGESSSADRALSGSLVLERLQLVKSGDHVPQQIRTGRRGTDRVSSSSKNSTAPRRKERSSFSSRTSKRRRPRVRISSRPSGYSRRTRSTVARAAGVDDAFFAGQNHAELELVAQHFADHFLIAVLENMQRKSCDPGSSTTWSGNSGSKPSCMLLLWRSRAGARHSAHCNAMILKLKRTPGIFLVGFMGSGKSTVGRALAEELGWGFADLDEDIEKREGMSDQPDFRHSRRSRVPASRDGRAAANASARSSAGSRA